MLKETETEETIVFFMTFLSLVAFQLDGGRAPWASPLATPMPPEKKFCPQPRQNQLYVYSSILIS